jgi:hypothetical protein
MPAATDNRRSPRAAIVVRAKAGIQRLEGAVEASGFQHSRKHKGYRSSAGSGLPHSL